MLAVEAAFRLPFVAVKTLCLGLRSVASAAADAAVLGSVKARNWQVVLDECLERACAEMLLWLDLITFQVVAKDVRGTLGESTRANNC